MRGDLNGVDLKIPPEP